MPPNLKLNLVGRTGPVAPAAALALTCAILLPVELLIRAGGLDFAPGAVLVLAVVLSAFLGGLPGGLASAAVVIAYAAARESNPGALFDFPRTGATRFAITVVTSLAAAVAVGLLRRQIRRQSESALASERDRAGRLVRASEDLARAVLASLPAHIVVIDPAGIIVNTNQAWDRFLDDTPGDVPRAPDHGVGRPYADVFRDTLGAWCEIADSVTAGIARVLARELPQFTTEYACHSPGQQRWYQLVATPLDAPSGNGSSGGAVVAHFDVTLRKRTELQFEELAGEIERQKDRLDEMLENVPAVVWEAYGRPGSSQRTEFVSRHAETLLDFPVRDWLATPDFWLARVPEAERDRAARDMAAAYDAGRDAALEHQWLTRAGRTLWVETSFTLIRNRGRPVGVRAVSVDVTARKRAQSALRRRAAQLVGVARALKRSNQELDQFAYVTSHDLRAPLRGISNISQWIEEDLATTFTPEAREHMNLLRGRVRRMEALIDGILEYSRVGRVAVRLEPVDVGHLVRDVVDLLAVPDTFTVDVAPDLPTITTERLRLQQVFMNLIGNAVKHHDKPRGTIRVTARRAPGRFHEFAVADDGPGIAPQFHDKIFVIFQTLQPRDRVEGTGVGLSLVKKIVENQGGAVRLDSAEGHGSTFTFTWPDRSPAPAPLAPPSDTTSQNQPEVHVG